VPAAVRRDREPGVFRIPRRLDGHRPLDRNRLTVREVASATTARDGNPSHAIVK
jgi:hypothetical protein